MLDTCAYLPDLKAVAVGCGDASSEPVPLLFLPAQTVLPLSTFEGYHVVNCRTQFGYTCIDRHIVEVRYDVNSWVREVIGLLLLPI